MDVNENNYIFDGRLVPVFNTIGERNENKILTCLIDFMYYYSIMSVEKREIDENEIFKYFVENIKKPLSLEKMLLDINIEIDAINYIQQYYKDIVKIKESIAESDFYPFIDIKKEYKREHYLKVMRNLLVENKDKEEVKAITNYLDKHRITDCNITDNYIQRIVDKVYVII